MQLISCFAFQKNFLPAKREVLGTFYLALFARRRQEYFGTRTQTVLFCSDFDRTQECFVRHQRANECRPRESKLQLPEKSIMILQNVSNNLVINWNFAKNHKTLKITRRAGNFEMTKRANHPKTVPSVKILRSQKAPNKRCEKSAERRTFCRDWLKRETRINCMRPNRLCRPPRRGNGFAI